MMMEEEEVAKLAEKASGVGTPFLTETHSQPPTHYMERSCTVGFQYSVISFSPRVSDHSSQFVSDNPCAVWQIMTVRTLAHVVS